GKIDGGLGPEPSAPSGSPPSGQRGTGGSGPPRSGGRRAGWAPSGGGALAPPPPPPRPPPPTPFLNPWTSGRAAPRPSAEALATAGPPTRSTVPGRSARG